MTQANTETLEDRMSRLADEWDEIGGIWSAFARDLREEVAAHESQPRNLTLTLRR